MTGQTLKADARNRALRTFVQGLVVSVGAALVVTLLTAIGSAHSWGEFAAALVAFSFFQSVATSALSWVMRSYLDRSHVPTPLPPTDDPAPGQD